jgi:hypothetical protein
VATGLGQLLEQYVVVYSGRLGRRIGLQARLYKGVAPARPIDAVPRQTRGSSKLRCTRRTTSGFGSKPSDFVKDFGLHRNSMAEATLGRGAKAGQQINFSLE